MSNNIALQISKMRQMYQSGGMKPLDGRIKRLTDLKAAIKHHENEILDALKSDLGKSKFEAFSTELSFVYDEIDLAVENLGDWSSAKEVAVPFTVGPANAHIMTVPKGLVLIISPWNYPFQLLISPLISAIAAGNVCCVKPSEISEKTTEISLKILREVFHPDVVYCVEGDASASKELLSFDWDHVFFTGSTQVGRIIAKACAERLIPYTLELGGKSPAIVDRDINIKATAKKIVWGKFLNAGQTCIGVDYLLLHESIKTEFVTSLKYWIREFYGEDPQKSPDYGRIINFTHYERVASMITSGTAVHGGRRDRSAKYIEPTIIEGVDLEHPAMAQEIFGPILPIITWKEKSEIDTLIGRNPNPLALYVFTNDAEFENRLLESIPFGGGCVNQTLLHFACPELPFGGFRQSGIGNYHGKFGFDLFSHSKGIYKAGKIDLPLKYPKYKAWKFKILKWLYR